MKILGTERQRNFSLSEVLLLLVILLHRNVLRMFGLWKTSRWMPSIQEGTYELENCDLNTLLLIERSLKEDGDYSEEDETSDNSSDSDTDVEELTLFRHELKTIYNIKGDEIDKKIKPIFKKTAEIINAKEEIFEDREGKVVIKLIQDEVKIRLRSIDVNFERPFKATELVEVETVIEEPFDFFPWGVFLSIKKYCFVTRNFFKMMNPKRTSARKRVDLYKYMFFCDFVNFFVIFLGFPEFTVS